MGGQLLWPGAVRSDDKHQETQIEYRSGAMPTREQFHERLREANEQYDPLDALLTLQRELIALEAKHGVTSEVACQRYQAGGSGDDLEVIWWAGRYRQYVQLSQMISVP